MKYQILIADDDEGTRDIFRLLLEQEGYELEIKADGNDLLNQDFTVPDLFLIDKQLPGVDGLAICRHLKNSPATAHIPVMMVSAFPDIGIAAQEAGADDHLEKPFDITMLLGKIRAQLEKIKALS